MSDELYRQAQRLIQSRALVYVLAGFFIVLWAAVSTVVGCVRRGRQAETERPRRRLPLR